MKVFAYLRVSTKEQLDGGGLDRQEKSVLEFCDKRGWTVARIFRDQQSGAAKVEDRKMLMDVLKLAGTDSATGVSTIVVESATRLSRELLHQEIFLSLCCEKNVEVYVADGEQEIALKEPDPTRILIRQMMGALAQWERSVITERLQAGRRKKARDTGVPCGGPKPYGQTPSELAVIDEVKALRELGLSFRAISGNLSNDGFPTPSGKPYWTAGSVFRIWQNLNSKRQ
jgi:DNA invertase Pin-like site-specific DNA recombinase